MSLTRDQRRALTTWARESAADVGERPIVAVEVMADYPGVVAGPLGLSDDQVIAWAERILTRAYGPREAP